MPLTPTSLPLNSNKDLTFEVSGHIRDAGLAGVNAVLIVHVLETMYNNQRVAAYETLSFKVALDKDNG